MITIPHHTGLGKRDDESVLVSFAKPYQNPKMRTTIELLSRHGSNERFNPLDSYSYSVGGVRYPAVKPPRKTTGPYAQQAWSKKLYLGVIAASDDHNAHPGLPLVLKRRHAKKDNAVVIINSPLAAVYAKDLTRDAIFNAIKMRRTYATSSGERIILNFTLNGYPMGSEVIVTKGQNPRLLITARGTDLIEFIEILKWDFRNGKFDEHGHPVFERILYSQVKALDTRKEFIDEKFNSFCMYYVRLKQLHKVRHQEVWAWSSPIWAKRGK